MCLSILAISFTIFYCSKNKTSFRYVEDFRKMNFSFEDYDVKSPEAAQAKLIKLFPEGSSLGEFRSMMEQSGAVCNISDALSAGETSNLIYCRYLTGNNPFVKSQWTVIAKIKDGSKMNELKVTAGLVGL
jgi:hypothetical protein